MQHDLGSARQKPTLVSVRKQRRDAAAAFILATVLGLILTVVPTVASGTLDRLAAESAAPAAQTAASAPTTSAMSASHAASIVDTRRWVTPVVAVGQDRALVTAGSHVPSSIDLKPAPAKSSASSPAHATAAAQSAAKASKTSTTVHTHAKAAASGPSLVGKNHFWFPAIGISNSVRNFNCAGSYVIPAGIWHFGCNGPRNIYLMSHAWSDFSALRVAYHAGNLTKGMTAYYAGPDGEVLRYKVAWIRHVTVETFNAGYWEWAINDVPAVTLQTCDGANSEYRIIVRLVRG